VKTRLLVAVMFARMRGRCLMSAWVVVVLLATWSGRSAASLRSLGVVMRLKIISLSAVGSDFRRIISFLAFFLPLTSVNSLGCFYATCA